MEDLISKKSPNGRAFLILKEGHRLSLEKARATVSDILKQENIHSPKGGWDKLVNINVGQKVYTFRELVTIIRLKGFPEPLQKLIDSRDEIYGGDIGISVSIHGFKTKKEWGGYSKELSAPCSIMPAEMELGKDIQFYREETCFATEDHNLELCIRNYKGAVFSSISLVEAYLNKYMLHREYSGFASENIIRYKQATNIETKFDLFLLESTGKRLEAINKTTAWVHFCQLRSLRNSFIHATEPFLGHSMKDFASNLNYINTGIGNLLRLTRDLQQKPTLSFIEIIRNGAIVLFDEEYYLG